MYPVMAASATGTTPAPPPISSRPLPFGALWERGARAKSVGRRANRNLGICRSAFLEPIGRGREAF